MVSEVPGPLPGWRVERDETENVHAFSRLCSFLTILSSLSTLTHISKMTLKIFSDHKIIKKSRYCASNRAQ